MNRYTRDTLTLLFNDVERWCLTADGVEVTYYPSFYRDSPTELLPFSDFDDVHPALTTSLKNMSAWAHRKAQNGSSLEALTGELVCCQIAYLTAPLVFHDRDGKSHHVAVVQHLSWEENDAPLRLWAYTYALLSELPATADKRAVQVEPFVCNNDFEDIYPDPVWFDQHYPGGLHRLETGIALGLGSSSLMNYVLTPANSAQVAPASLSGVNFD